MRRPPASRRPMRRARRSPSRCRASSGCRRCWRARSRVRDRRFWWSVTSSAALLHGPILGFWGDQDVAVGMPNVERLAAALRGRGVAYSHTIYPGVGHAFLAATPNDADPAPYQAARDSWNQTLAFYATHLRA